jgi:hypothetical protein
MPRLSLHWLTALPQDLRFAFRTLRKAPVFTLASILTIALGIAANASISSVVNAAIIRALPYPDPDHLYQVAERNERLNLPHFSASSLNDQSWKEQTRTFEDLGAFGYATCSLTDDGERPLQRAASQPAACGRRPDRRDGPVVHAGRVAPRSDRGASRALSCRRRRYSARSTTIGSVRVARRAGTTTATNDTPTTRTATAP